MSLTSLVLLPFPHLGASARCFDNAELRRQTALSELVWNRLRRRSSYSPVTREPSLGASEAMWGGYSLFLLTYVNALKAECAARGYKTAPIEPIDNRLSNFVHPTPWFGDERVHFTHQALLLKRNPRFYESRCKGLFGVTANYPLFTPSNYVYLFWYHNRNQQTKIFDFSIFDSA
jgi:hypothetical protein